MKSILCATAGIVIGQCRLEACTVDDGPGTVLNIYVYIKCVCVCVIYKDMQCSSVFGLKYFIPHLYKMHCT